MIILSLLFPLINNYEYEQYNFRLIQNKKLLATSNCVYIINLIGLFVLYANIKELSNTVVIKKSNFIIEQFNNSSYMHWFKYKKLLANS